MFQERLAEADTMAREAESVARRWGYRKGQADALVVRSGVARAQSDNDTADRHLKEAQRIYNILHDPLGMELERVLSNA